MRNNIEDIRDPLNKSIEEINFILDSKIKEKYYYAIFLAFAIIEFNLKFVIFMNQTWKFANKKISQNKFEKIANITGEKIKNMNFADLIKDALINDLVSVKLYTMLEKARKERNELVHSIWFHARRNDFRFLRKKLEMLCNLGSDLVSILNKTYSKIGIDEIFSPKVVRTFLKGL